MSEFKLDHVAAVVAAHLSTHAAVVSLTELYDTILTVRRGFEAELVVTVAAPVAPAVVEPVKKSMREVKASIKPDGLVSFEDGKTYKTLTRHLGRHGLTPKEYKEKHGLPLEYPMVAPEYSRRRSELAKKMGLGTNPERREESYK